VLEERLGGWRQLFPLAFAGLLVLGMGDAMLGVAWPWARSGFGQPLAALGEVTLALTAGYLAASPLSGWFSVRLGTGSYLAVAALVGVVALGGFALAPSWPLFVASGAVYGLWSGSIDPGVNSWTALLGDVRAMNLVHFAYGAGATLGPLVVTASLAFGLGWRAAYGAVATAVLMLAAGLAMTRRGWGRPSADGEKPRPRPARRHLLFLGATMATFFVYVGVEVGTGQWTYSHLVGLGTAPGLAGLTVSVYWGALTAGRLFLALTGDRLGAFALLLTSCAVALLGGVLYVRLPAGAGALPAVGLLGLGFAGVFPLLVSLTSTRSGARQTPYVVGYMLGSANVGAAVVVAGMGLGMQALGVAALPAFVLAGIVLLVTLNLVTERLSR
jgi:MFS family permease